MRLGIIDVGTNSIHLLIGSITRRKAFHVILHRQHLVRLGEGGFVRGMLTRQAVGRALNVLQGFAAALTRYRVEHVEAVATSAVRDASNGPAFVRRVRRELGLPLRIISGLEEARLIYQGIQGAHRFPHQILLVTVGGGSAQVVLGVGSRVRYATSMRLGAARLAARFLHHDPPRASEVSALDRAVRQVWAPVIQAVRRHTWVNALASSAMIHQLMVAAALRSHRRVPGRVKPESISQGALRELIAWLSTSTASTRQAFPGLDLAREDLALPTGIVLLTWMELCGLSTVRYASGSLREGLVVHFLSRSFGC